MEYGSTLMEYGSTPYVGMARERNGCHIMTVQNYALKCLHLMTQIEYVHTTCHHAFFYLTLCVLADFYNQSPDSQQSARSPSKPGNAIILHVLRN